MERIPAPLLYRSPGTAENRAQSLYTRSGAAVAPGLSRQTASGLSLGKEQRERRGGGSHRVAGTFPLVTVRHRVLVNSAVTISQAVTSMRLWPKTKTRHVPPPQPQTVSFPRARGPPSRHTAAAHLGTSTRRHRTRQDHSRDVFGFSNFIILSLKICKIFQNLKGTKSVQWKAPFAWTPV